MSLTAPTPMQSQAVTDYDMHFKVAKRVLTWLTFAVWEVEVSLCALVTERAGKVLLARALERALGDAERDAVVLEAVKYGIELLH